MGSCFSSEGNVTDSSETKFFPMPQDSRLKSVPKNILPNASPDIEKTYSMGKELGRGQYGICCKAVHKKENKVYAVKSIAKTKLKYQEEVDDIVREIEILQKLKGHPNIVEFKEVFEDAVTVQISMGLCTGGELFDAILAKGHYSERDAANILHSMATVMSFCHKSRVFHRDLKPENFLFDDKDQVKLTDFGLSVIFNEGDIYTERLGSAYYIAPEVLKGKYDYRADMWSLGVIMYILLSGYPPFYGNDDDEIFKAVKRGTFDCDSGEEWTSVSSEAKGVIKSLLVLQPEKRMTAEELLNSPWVQGKASERALSGKVMDKMKKFSAENKLKKAALYLMGQHCTPQEISEISTVFKKLDNDGNGYITLDELRAGLKDVIQNAGKKSEQELENVIMNADVDGDGKIDYNEFIAATINLNQGDLNEKILKVFQEIDSDNSGFITPDEIVASFERLGIETDGVDELIVQVDKNKDGKIDYGEFRAMMFDHTPEDMTKGSQMNARRPSMICQMYGGLAPS